MELFNGRPADISDREPREVRAYDLLDRLCIEFIRADHPAAMTMDDCIAIDRALGVLMCKNLFLCNRQKTCYYLLLMPGDKPFKTKDLSAQLGIARLSFAGEDDMLALMDLTPGSVSVLGLMNDRDEQVRLVIDKEVFEQEYIGCHPCMNTSSIKFKVSDLKEKLLPDIGHTPTIVEL